MGESLCNRVDKASFQAERHRHVFTSNLTSRTFGRSCQCREPEMIAAGRCTRSLFTHWARDIMNERRVQLSRLWTKKKNDPAQESMRCLAIERLLKPPGAESRGARAWFSLTKLRKIKASYEGSGCSLSRRTLLPGGVEVPFCHRTDAAHLSKYTAFSPHNQRAWFTKG